MVKHQSIATQISGKSIIKICSKFGSIRVRQVGFIISLHIFDPSLALPFQGEAALLPLPSGEGWGEGGFSS
jgi:hypothetical protein